MKIKVPYGKDGELNAEISDDIATSFLEANDVFIDDPEKLIIQAVNNPINSKNLLDFLSDAKDLLVIVNDATRPTPTKQILDIIFDDIT
ncbi:MAG: lactate racemase domain-containing protein, partial [Thermodesulfobacteriota bacterium]|nr:lactate racemase domain-containing protein [Thermodesulfobacteriota bacterium]